MNAARRSTDAPEGRGTVASATSRWGGVRRLGADRKGVAAVEFVVAMVPLFLIFFCFLQVAKVHTAHLIFQHAATIAARTAAVIVEPTINPGDNGSEDDVTAVAKQALGAWQTAIRDVDVSIRDEASISDPNGMVTVTMTGNFLCGVAMGATVACGADHLAPMTATASFPLQGARYRIGVGADTKTPIGSLPSPSGGTVCDPNSPFSVCSP